MPSHTVCILQRVQVGVFALDRFTGTIVDLDAEDWTPGPAAPPPAPAPFWKWMIATQHSEPTDQSPQSQPGDIIIVPPGTDVLSLLAGGYTVPIEGPSTLRWRGGTAIDRCRKQVRGARYVALVTIWDQSNANANPRYQLAGSYGRLSGINVPEDQIDAARAYLLAP